MGPDGLWVFVMNNFSLSINTDRLAIVKDCHFRLMLGEQCASCLDDFTDLRVLYLL